MLEVNTFIFLFKGVVYRLKAERCGDQFSALKFEEDLLNYYMNGTLSKSTKNNVTLLLSLFDAELKLTVEDYQRLVLIPEDNTQRPRRLLTASMLGKELSYAIVHIVVSVKFHVVFSYFLWPQIVTEENSEQLQLDGSESIMDVGRSESILDPKHGKNKDTINATWK